MGTQDVRIIEEVDNFRKKKKTTNILFIVVFAILTLASLICIIVLGSDPITVDLTDPTTAEISVTDERIVMSESVLLYSNKFTATVENNTDRDLSYVKITYSFFNKDGVEVETETKEVSEVKASDTKEFSISFYSSIYDGKITSYEVTEIIIPGVPVVSAGVQALISILMLIGIGGIIFFSIRIKKKDLTTENKIFNTVLNTELKARNFDEGSEKIFVNSIQIRNTNQNQNAVPIFIVDRVNEQICFIDHNSNSLVFKSIEDTKGYTITVNGKIFTKDNRKEWINEVNKSVGVIVKQLCLEIKLNNFDGGSILYDFAAITNGTVVSKNIIEPLDEAIKLLDEFTSEEKSVQRKKTWRCPYCKTLNPEDSNKCSSCGSIRND